MVALLILLEAKDSFASGVKTDVGYRGGMLVPGLFHWPKKRWNDGRRFDGVVTHYDIMPTVAKLLNCEGKDKYHGEDISSIVNMEDTVRERGVYWFFVLGNHTIIEETQVEK